MNAKHTPDPWGIITMEAEGFLNHIVHPEGREMTVIAQVPIGMQGEDNQEKEANASLIAKAWLIPELLEGLKAIATALDRPRNRFGKLEVDPVRTEPVRLLAVKYKVPGAEDTIEQAMFVARALVAKAEGGNRGN